MHIELKVENNTSIFEIEGSIDSKTASEAQQTILKGAQNTSNVILEMSKVDFVSSAGLRVLLMVYRQIKSVNGKVVLVAVSEEIREVMNMTGFINFFELTNTIVEAQKSF